MRLLVATGVDDAKIDDRPVDKAPHHPALSSCIKSVWTNRVYSVVGASRNDYN
jgi:hypothetical protein